MHPRTTRDVIYKLGTITILGIWRAGMCALAPVYALLSVFLTSVKERPG